MSGVGQAGVGQWRRCRLRAGLAALGVFLGALGLAGTGRAEDFDKEPIRYGQAPADNPVERLQQRLKAGKARLTHEKGFGYLRGVLRELAVPPSSQMLVFSKTSLQRHRIRPRTPRAVYFSDDVYVGYCRHGDVMELAAADPQLGVVFYTLDQAADKKPAFRRRGETCLLCHGSSRNQGFPGLLVRSVFPDAAGLPILSGGTRQIDHTSPLKDRWGGWYVTGTSGRQEHLGNLIIRTREVPERVDNAAGRNVTDLGKRIERSAYLSGHSDIVALMVLEHQAEAHNRLVRANFETRLALHQAAALNREMKLPADYQWESTGVRLRSVGDALVKYLLFSGEAKLTGRVRGTSGFAAEFARRGPRDPKGRSLRDLDLERRLFKYPCSYLIYSRSFDGLPGPVKDYVLRRIWDVLTGKETGKDFRHLGAADRQAIREILVATKPNLPAYWRAKATPPKGR
jgi:hypothetical protein